MCLPLRPSRTRTFSSTRSRPCALSFRPLRRRPSPLASSTRLLTYVLIVICSCYELLLLLLLVVIVSVFLNYLICVVLLVIVILLSFCSLRRRPSPRSKSSLSVFLLLFSLIYSYCSLVDDCSAPASHFIYLLFSFLLFSFNYFIPLIYSFKLLLILCAVDDCSAPARVSATAWHLGVICCRRGRAKGWRDGKFLHNINILLIFFIF